MIPKETVDLIMDTARIEEVVGDFVTLKKRGVSLIGLCPFHNEKTPSFNVSATKGIYKCFGCGKSGNAVTFVMEHEHFSYPEALRYLAGKYQIPLGEEERTPEMIREQLHRESLFVVMEFARNYYVEQMHNSDEGRSVGLSYFHQREFTEAMLSKFQLGYAPDTWRGFTDHALASGFSTEQLEQAGLVTVNDGKMYDRFRGRVVFPIHNVTGKVIAFGARILRTDPKSPKYLNSPETDIYHKSRILYGVFFAKKSIIAHDSCYLVEGYTDVIALHQAGIENVVASSGTSLTVEQIRLIGRYTRNITVLYDGDPAGIKASMRGIDLILEEGLNVQVVLFPEGDDPDSFSRKHTSYELADFLGTHAQDFIKFKTSLLLGEVANDPVRKAGLIRDIVETIARIPDPIMRSTYIRECSGIMSIEETILIGELNKVIRRSVTRSQAAATEVPDTTDELLDEIIEKPEGLFDEQSSAAQETDIIRLLINYGHCELPFEEQIDEKHTTTITETVLNFIVTDLSEDNIEMQQPVFARIFKEFVRMRHESIVYHPTMFTNHEDSEISSLAADMLTVKYPLAQWGDKGIHVVEESTRLKHAVVSALYSYKIKQVYKMIRENREAIKTAAEQEQEIQPLLEQQIELDKLKTALSEYLSIVVLK